MSGHDNRHCVQNWRCYDGGLDVNALFSVFLELKVRLEGLKGGGHGKMKILLHNVKLA